MKRDLVTLPRKPRTPALRQIYARARFLAHSRIFLNIILFLFLFLFLFISLLLLLFLTDFVLVLPRRQRQSMLFEKIDIVESTPSRLRVNTWTKSEWLDVIDITFSPLPLDPRPCSRTHPISFETHALIVHRARHVLC
jgi:hypothetical protein